jgi:hypothetical protein
MLFCEEFSISFDYAFESLDLFLKQGTELAFASFCQNSIEELLATHTLPSLQPGLEQTKEPEVTRGNIRQRWRMRDSVEASLAVLGFRLPGIVGESISDVDIQPVKCISGHVFAISRPSSEIA